MNTAINNRLIDLHTHILPEIDDGARSAKESIELLKMQIDMGVGTVALTPHFSFERDSLDKFLLKRQHAFDMLNVEAQKLANCPKLILGAEVVFSTRIIENDMNKLCYAGKNAMLLELPINFCPKWTGDILFEMSVAGITPVLAHVERFVYLMEDLDLFKSFINAGALAQVNAKSLIESGRRRRTALKLIDKGLAHIVASDAHSLGKRPPNIAEGMQIVAKKLGDGVANNIVKRAAGLI